MGKSLKWVEAEKLGDAVSQELDYDRETRSIGPVKQPEIEVETQEFTPRPAVARTPLSINIYD